MTGAKRMPQHEGHTWQMGCCLDGGGNRMADVLTSYGVPVTDGQGRSFHARAVGRLADDRMWEGWFEFMPLSGDGAVVIGPVETRQPERHDLDYWATGITPIYLEGALDRAQRPLTVRVRVPEVAVSSEPAPRARPVASGPTRPDAILDPFDVGGRSLDILRQELHALNRPRLTNIIVAFDLNPAGEDLSWMTDAQLVTFIVTATEVRLSRRAEQLVGGSQHDPAKTFR